MSSPSSAESQPTSIVPNTSEVTTTTNASTTSAVTTTASYPPVLTTTTATTTATILPTTNNMNNNNSFLSEQEDNDVSLSSSITRNKIEVSECDGADYDDDDDDGADDESEYSYDYEEDDDGHYTGFIVSSSSPSLNQAQQQQQQSHDTIGKAAVVPRDDIVDDYDENDEKNYRKNNNDSNSTNNSNTENDHIQFASLEQTNTTIAKKSTWKEPSQQAVSMSLRVESEKTGGRRRLAADLYKIMMHDTNEAGFSVESADEESMDKWTIKLFKFDEDSNLHKDMLILGLDHIELEMNFPDQVSTQ